MINVPYVTPWNFLGLTILKIYRASLTGCTMFLKAIPLTLGLVTAFPLSLVVLVFLFMLEILLKILVVVFSWVLTVMT